MNPITDSAKPDTNHARTWQAPIVRDFVKRAKARVGEQGWKYLSEEMRSALIAKEFALVVLANDRAEFACLGVLYQDMLREAGL